MPPSLSIVIPAYNESANLPSVIAEAVALDPAEILVCDDASTDNTPSVLASLAARHPSLRILRNPQNLGVALTLARLYREARGPLVFFAPGDGQVGAAQVARLLPLLDRADVVVGVRRHRRDPQLRRINARVYNLAVRILLGLNVQDVDSVTLFRKEVLDAVQCRSRGIVRCAELLVRARRLGYRVAEAEVEHRPRVAGRQTGAGVGFIATAAVELARLAILDAR